MADLETLKLKIIDGSDTSVDPLEKLAASLVTLKKATSGSVKGLEKTATGISTISNAVAKLDGSALVKLKSLADGIQKLQAMSNVKLSATLPGNITKLTTSMKSIPSDATAKISGLANALTPLTKLGKSSLTPFVTQLSKLPTVLNQIDMQKLYNQISSLTRILKPFADEMAKITAGFDRFPTRIQNLVRSTERYNSAVKKTTTTNNLFNSSFATMIAKLYVLQRVFNVIGSLINKSNAYQESLNLFTASMGEYADAAFEYGQKVSEVMGIDIADWIYNQGIFMTMATGFGVAGDSAAKMSEQLTQLGYDISSFYNMSVEDAMLKLQSGLSGELEPLRRLGYDLSQARLEQEALNLGIDKSVSSMTQAEKAQLRYIAIMTQVTQVQGDMARTLESPANQLRILQAQLEMAGRAIGNIFIPALNAILPYAIAVVQVIREIADAIASLFGFELTEVDYSGIGAVAGDAADLKGELGGVNDALEKMQSYTLGFDELNVLDQDTGSGTGGGASAGGGSGFEFELPEYDFLGDAVSGRVDEIMAKLRPQIDWIKENLDQILTIIGIIGAGFLAWKISSGLITGISGLLSMIKGGSVLSKGLSIALGFTLVGTSIALLVDGIKHALEDGLQGIDFAEMLMGALGLAGGGAVLGSAFKAGLTPLITKLGLSIPATLFGAAVGAIGGGVTLFITGIYLALRDGIDWIIASLITAGGALAGAGIGALIGSVGGPLGAAIGALVGVVVSGIIAIYQNWGAIAPWMQENVIDPVSEFFVDLWDGITVGAVSLAENIKEKWNGIVSFFQSVFSSIASFATGKIESIKNAWNAISTWFYDNVTFPIKIFFTNLWESIASSAKNVWGSILEYFSPAITWFSELFRSVGQTASDVFYNIGVLATGTWEVIKSVWSIFSEWFEERIELVSESFGKLWGSINQFANSAWTKVKSYWNDLYTWFNEKITSVKTSFYEMFESISIFASTSWTKLEGYWSSAAKWFSWNVVTPISTAFSTMFNNIKSWASGVWSSVKSTFGNLASWFRDIFSDAWSGIVSVFSVGGQIFTNIKNGILTAFKSIVNRLISGINNVVKVPFEGINKALSAIRGVEVAGLKPFSGLGTISVPVIPMLYADGGFPSVGEMFIANEAGPEMIGRMGSGSAVANNDQIAQGFASAIYPAMYKAVSEAMSGGGGDINLTVKTELDGQVVYTNQEKIKRERGQNIGMGVFAR